MLSKVEVTVPSLRGVSVPGDVEGCAIGIEGAVPVAGEVGLGRAERGEGQGGYSEDRESLVRNATFMNLLTADEKAPRRAQDGVIWEGLHAERGTPERAGKFNGIVEVDPSGWALAAGLPDAAGSAYNSLVMGKAKPDTFQVACPDCGAMILVDAAPGW